MSGRVKVEDKQSNKHYNKNKHACKQLQHISPHSSIASSGGFTVMRSQSGLDRSPNQVNRPHGGSKCAVGTMSLMNYVTLKWGVLRRYRCENEKQ